MNSGISNRSFYLEISAHLLIHNSSANRIGRVCESYSRVRAGRNNPVDFVQRLLVQVPAEASKVVLQVIHCAGSYDG